MPCLVLPEGCTPIHLSQSGWVLFRKPLPGGGSVLCKSYLSKEKEIDCQTKLRHQYEVLSLAYSLAATSATSSSIAASTVTNNPPATIPTATALTDQKPQPQQPLSVIQPLRLTVDQIGLKPSESQPEEIPQSDRMVLEMEDTPQQAGRTLKQMFLERGVGSRPERVTFSIFLQVALQLASALERIHDCNIILRNLHPNNIIIWKNELTNEFNVQLMDFSRSAYVEKGSSMEPDAPPRRYAKRQTYPSQTSQYDALFES